MASIQCERNEEITMQLSREEKASLDEIIKQAECSLESQQLKNQSLAVVAENECLDKAAAAKIQMTLVVGGLKNYTKGPQNIMSFMNYAGYFVKKFPNPLYSFGTFSMASVFDSGDKAAVVYSDNNKAGVECGWLLGFADTKATGRKVYVSCGRKSNFYNIDWAQVEKKVDNGGAIAKYYDSDTGTSVYASIVGYNGKYVVATIFLG